MRKFIIAIVTCAVAILMTSCLQSDINDINQVDATEYNEISNNIHTDASQADNVYVQSNNNVHNQVYLSSIVDLHVLDPSSFTSFHESVVNFDPRLISFSEEFFIEIDQVAQAFINTFYYKDTSYLERHLSQNVIIRDGSEARYEDMIVRVFDVVNLFQHMFEGDPPQSMLEFYVGELFRQNIPRGAYIISANQSQDTIRTGSLFGHDTIQTGPNFLGIYADDFPNVALVYNTTITYPILETWSQRTLDVHLHLENMSFKLIHIEEH